MIVVVAAWVIVVAVPFVGFRLVRQWLRDSWEPPTTPIANRYYQKTDKQ